VLLDEDGGVIGVYMHTQGSIRHCLHFTGAKESVGPSTLELTNLFSRLRCPKKGPKCSLQASSKQASSAQ
jgi:hypothetical protein